MSNRNAARIAGLVLMFAIGTGTGVIAQEQANQAAVVVALQDGQVITRCVTFEEEKISGLELLSRTDLALEADITGMGASICRIQESGCPVNDCFCQCKGGGPCLYWSYWHLRQGEWQYAQGGASVYQVGDGDVEGWVWGVGAPNEAPEPPDVSFAEVCQADHSATTVVGAAETASRAELPAGSPLEREDESARQTPSSVETSPNDGDAQRETTPPDRLARDRPSPWYVMIGLGMVSLAAVMILSRKRKEAA